MKSQIKKCFIFNEACLNNIKQFDIIPIMEEEYKIKDRYNELLNKFLPLCQSLEKANIKLKQNPIRVRQICLSPRVLSYLEQLAFEQSQFVFDVLKIVSKDKVLMDLELEDLEQIVYVLNKICFCACERMDICLKELDLMISRSEKQNLEGNREN